MRLRLALVILALLSSVGRADAQHPPRYDRIARDLTCRVIDGVPTLVGVVGFTSVKPGMELSLKTEAVLRRNGVHIESQFLTVFAQPPSAASDCAGACIAPDKACVSYDGGVLSDCEKISFEIHFAAFPAPGESFELELVGTPGSQPEIDTSNDKQQKDIPGNDAVGRDDEDLKNPGPRDRDPGEEHDNAKEDHDQVDPNAVPNWNRRASNIEYFPSPTDAAACRVVGHVAAMADDLAAEIDLGTAADLYVNGVRVDVGVLDFVGTPGFLPNSCAADCDLTNDDCVSLPPGPFAECGFLVARVEFSVDVFGGDDIRLVVRQRDALAVVETHTPDDVLGSVVPRKSAPGQPVEDEPDEPKNDEPNERDPNERDPNEKEPTHNDEPKDDERDDEPKDDEREDEPTPQWNRRSSDVEYRPSPSDPAACRVVAHVAASADDLVAEIDLGTAVDLYVNGVREAVDYADFVGTPGFLPNACAANCDLANDDCVSLPAGPFAECRVLVTRIEFPIDVFAGDSVRVLVRQRDFSAVVETYTADDVLAQIVPRKAPVAPGDVEDDPQRETAQENRFLRGDVVPDGAVTITDMIAILDYLFGGEGELPCEDAADTDDSGDLTLTDAVVGLGALFLGQGPLPQPGMDECGADPTEDGLSCLSYDACDA